MDVKSKNAIALANDAIATAIKKQVKDEISSKISVDSSFTEFSNFLGVIKDIKEPEVQEKLLDKYLTIVEIHQSTKDDEYFKQIKREHDNRTKILEMETTKQELRTKLFTNQKLIIFFMVFPIIIGFILVYFFKAYVFASFIILMWYGMILAFYFSQSDALIKLIKVFQGKNIDT